MFKPNLKSVPNLFEDKFRTVLHLRRKMSFHIERELVPAPAGSKRESNANDRYAKNISRHVRDYGFLNKDFLLHFNVKVLSVITGVKKLNFYKYNNLFNYNTI